MSVRPNQEAIEAREPVEDWAGEMSMRPLSPLESEQAVDDMLTLVSDHRRALGRVRELEDALQAVRTRQQDTLGWLRENGIVFDGPLGTDPKNWQQVAFSIYTDLCEVECIAAAVSPERTSGPTCERCGGSGCTDVDGTDSYDCPVCASGPEGDTT